MAFALGIGTLALLVLSLGCQNYERAPLEPGVHRSAWHGRSLGGESLHGFVARLSAACDSSAFAGVTVDSFDATDGLSLAEAQCVALLFSPALRLARASAGIAVASSENAGLWPDPSFSVSALRIDESIPDPWLITPTLSFRVPLTGRLAGESAVAREELAVAQARVREQEWGVWMDVRRTWARWSAACFTLEEAERYLALLDPLTGTAANLARTGEITDSEASLFFVERGQRANQLYRLRAAVEVEEQRLRSQLGLAPEAPVSFLPDLSSLGQHGLEDGASPESLASRNLTLVRREAAYRASEERLRLEIRKQLPDLRVGPSFEEDAGRFSFGLLLGSFPIPIWSANRKGIAEARAQRELARVAFETEYEWLVGRWQAARVLARGMRAQREGMEAELVPAVERQLAQALALMELGEVRSLVVLQTLSRALETRLEWIDTRLGEALAQADVDTLVGPPADWSRVVREAQAESEEQ